MKNQGQHPDYVPKKGSTDYIQPFLYLQRGTVHCFAVGLQCPLHRTVRPLHFDLGWCNIYHAHSDCCFLGLFLAIPFEILRGVGMEKIADHLSKSVGVFHDYACYVMIFHDRNQVFITIFFGTPPPQHIFFFRRPPDIF